MNEKHPESRDDTLPLSEIVPVAEIPADGREGKIVLNRTQRGALAALLDVRSIDHFEFEYKLSDIGRRRFRLTGTLSAAVRQECVVTLEPIESEIADALDLELWPEKDVAMAEKLAQEDGRSVLIDGPEPIEGGVIDIGQLAYEHFSSVIDPYPRKKNAQFQWSNDGDEADKPFASLGKLLGNEPE